MSAPKPELHISLLEKLEKVLEGILTEMTASRSGRNLTTKHDLNAMEGRIMSAISDFAAKQKAFNERQAASIDKALASVDGLTTDVKALNDKITELQTSVGGVTPEDQALIDSLETQGSALADKLDGVATALATLDAQTPPTPPTA